MTQAAGVTREHSAAPCILRRETGDEAWHGMAWHKSTLDRIASVALRALIRIRISLHPKYSMRITSGSYAWSDPRENLGKDGDFVSDSGNWVHDSALPVEIAMNASTSVARRLGRKEGGKKEKEKKKKKSLKQWLNSHAPGIWRYNCR